MPFPQKRMWTKDEIKTVLTLWSSRNTEDIADILGRSHGSVSAMAASLRKYGAKLPRKKRKNATALLIKEALSEM